MEERDRINEGGEMEEGGQGGARQRETRKEINKDKINKKIKKNK